MRRFLLASSILAGAAALTLSANAAPITYQLNTILGSSLSPATESFGTVTYTDHGDAVDVTIDLATNSWKALSMTMNYDDARFPIGYGNWWSVTGDATNLQVTEDGIKADGYSAGRFDIEVPDHGNLGGNPDPYTFTISLTKYGAPIDLDPTDFDFRDSSNKLYNAVHIGNLNDCYHDSIWVGSGPASVPEPASLALLGLGLAALGFVRSRKAI